jgi:TctA family transporter
MRKVMQHEHMSEPTKHIIDVASVTSLLGTLVGVLPDITAFLTFVWMCIRIYETDTVQSILGRKKAKDETNTKL